MQNTVYIGVDNGVSGSFGVVYQDQSFFFPTPTKVEQDYTKKKKNITRVDTLALDVQLYTVLSDISIGSVDESLRIFASVERPMVNPGRFFATTSAVRALEAFLTFLDWCKLDIAFQFVDSKQWQKELLPKGVKGSPELKMASKHVGCCLFPTHKEAIEKHKDADGLLIAEWSKRKGF